MTSTANAAASETQSNNPQNWLLTSSSGNIGSHVSNAILASGKDAVTDDSLYQGFESLIGYQCKRYNKEIQFIVADIRDTSKFNEILATYTPFVVVHIAALRAVGESMEKPEEFIEVNFNATTKMLELISKHGIKNFILSSPSAVYGTPDHSNPI